MKGLPLRRALLFVSGRHLGGSVGRACVGCNRSVGPDEFYAWCGLQVEAIDLLLECDRSGAERLDA